MNVLFVRMSQNRLANTLEPVHDGFYSMVDACIVVGYCLSVFTILPAFVVLAWGFDILSETSW